MPKSIGTYLYSRSVATSNMKLFSAFFIKLWSAQAWRAAADAAAADAAAADAAAADAAAAAAAASRSKP